MAAIEFRVFLVMDNKVARQAMAENDRKWQEMAVMGFRAFLVMDIEVSR